MNILFLSAGSKVSLIKNFRNRLNGGGNRIMVCDSDPDSPSFYFSDKYYVVKKYNEGGIDDINEICENEKVNIVIPTSEIDLSQISSGLRWIDKKFYTLVSTNLLLRNKENFYADCKAEGVPVPNTYLPTYLRAFSQDQFIPCFIKPKFGCASLNTTKIYNYEALCDFFLTHEPSEFLIQELLDGDEYSIDIFNNPFYEPYYVVPRKRIKIKNGESVVGETIKNQDLINWAYRISEVFHIIGPATIQCFITTSGDIKFTEINARFCGGTHLSHAAGADYVEATKSFYNEINGKKSTYGAGPLDWIEHVKMIRYTDDIFDYDSCYEIGEDSP